jgi:hypothetical protein
VAARRLQDNPAAGFRAVSGITVAVFVGTVFGALGASAGTSNEFGPEGMAAGVVAAEPTIDPDAPFVTHYPWFAIQPGPLRDLRTDLEAIPGVNRMVTLHALPEDPAFIDTLNRARGIGLPQALVACDDAVAMGFGGCDGATVLEITPTDIWPIGVTIDTPSGGLDDLAVVTLAAVTDGRAESVEAARTQLDVALPGPRAVTGADIVATARATLDTIRRMTTIGIAVTLVIAGFSLAVAVAGALVERKRAFALMRLAGTRLSDLRRVVMAEATAPLVGVAALGSGLGVLVAYLVLVAAGDGEAFAPPAPTHWLALLGGIGAGLVVVMATLPLLSRVTNPESARFE